MNDLNVRAVDVERVADLLKSTGARAIRDAVKCLMEERGTSGSSLESMRAGDLNRVDRENALANLLIELTGGLG